jgi:hypothetical protein
MGTSIGEIQCSTKPHVHQKFDFFWTNIASTMACSNFKNGPKNGLCSLGVNHLDTFVERRWRQLCSQFLS